MQNTNQTNLGRSTVMTCHYASPPVHVAQLVVQLGSMLPLQTKLQLVLAENRPEVSLSKLKSKRDHG